MEAEALIIQGWKLAGVLPNAMVVIAIGKDSPKNICLFRVKLIAQ